jgi:hypothetical protein
MQIDALLKRDIVVMLNNITVIAEQGDIVKVDPEAQYVVLDGYYIEIYRDEYHVIN